MNEAALFELELIRSFVAVAERSSFTLAADSLHLTQSTVSQQIRRLEKRVGKPLFHRSTRSVILSDDGEILLGYAQTLLRVAADAKARMTSPRLHGRLSLAASDDLATKWLPLVLKQFHRQHPQVRLDVHIGISDDLVKQMDDGAFDLVLGKRRIGSTRGSVIHRTPLVWVGSASVVEPSRPLPLALFPKPCVYRAAALEALEARGQAWEIVLTSPSLAGIHVAVQAGLAITPLAASLVGPIPLLDSTAVGIPSLADIEIVLFRHPRADDVPAVMALENLLRTYPHNHPT